MRNRVIQSIIIKSVVKLYINGLDNVQSFRNTKTIELI